MRTHSMSIREFMHPEPEGKKSKMKKMAKVAVPVVAPFTFAPKAFAATPGDSIVANAVTDKIATESFEVMAHIFDPVIDLVVSMSFPICSLYILASCFHFLSSQEKALEKISKGAITYVVIQLFPVIQTILMQIGEAV
jgi:hypothetical protein